MTDFRQYSSEQLKTKYRMALDRSNRADTSENYLRDMYLMQEVSAVLQERELEQALEILQAAILKT